MEQYQKTNVNTYLTLFIICLRLHSAKQVNIPSLWHSYIYRMTKNSELQYNNLTDVMLTSGKKYNKFNVHSKDCTKLQNNKVDSILSSDFLYILHTEVKKQQQ